MAMNLLVRQKSGEKLEEVVQRKRMERGCLEREYTRERNVLFDRVDGEEKDREYTGGWGRKKRRSS